jgi:hypothetical protein
MGAAVAEVVRAFEPQRAAPLAEGVSPGAGRCLSRPGKAALERDSGGPTGAQDWPAGAGDRFLKVCFERIDEQRKLQAFNGQLLSTSRSKPRGNGAKD